VKYAHYRRKTHKPCVCAQAEFGDCNATTTCNFLDDSDFWSCNLNSMSNPKKLKNTPPIQTSVCPLHETRPCQTKDSQALCVCRLQIFPTPRSSPSLRCFPTSRITMGRMG
jgi:hypothetical protein